MVSVFNCYTLHSMSPFLLEMLLFSLWVVVSCCLSMSVPIVLFSHDSMYSLRCALTKPCWNKRAQPLKRKQSLLCDHLLCPIFQALLLKTRSHLPGDKECGPRLPPSHLSRPKYLRVVYSSSVDSDVAVELNCMVWYV